MERTLLIMDWFMEASSVFGIIELENVKNTIGMTSMDACSSS